MHAAGAIENLLKKAGNDPTAIDRKSRSPDNKDMSRSDQTWPPGTTGFARTGRALNETDRRRSALKKLRGEMVGPDHQDHGGSISIRRLMPVEGTWTGATCTAWS